MLQHELRALTAHPPRGNADIFEYKYTKKTSNFGTELGWIWPRNRAFFFAVEEAQFFGQLEDSSTLSDPADGLSGGKESWKRCLRKAERRIRSVGEGR